MKDGSDCQVTLTEVVIRVVLRAAAVHSGNRGSLRETASAKEESVALSPRISWDRFTDFDRVIRKEVMEDHVTDITKDGVGVVPGTVESEDSAIILQELLEGRFGKRWTSGLHAGKELISLDFIRIARILGVTRNSNFQACKEILPKILVVGTRRFAIHHRTLVNSSHPTILNVLA
jgi:hypothetical protein